MKSDLDELEDEPQDTFSPIQKLITRFNDIWENLEEDNIWRKFLVLLYCSDHKYTKEELLPILNSDIISVINDVKDDVIRYLINDMSNTEASDIEEDSDMEEEEEEAEECSEMDTSSDDGSEEDELEDSD